MPNYFLNRKAAGGNQAAVVYRRSKRINKSGNRQRYFDKSALITPAKLLDTQQIKYRKSSDWLQVFCPLHKGGMESNPSLSMHFASGHFKCHACGIKGGDIIEFYRMLTGCSFTEAVKFLGGYHA